MATSFQFERERLSARQTRARAWLALAGCLVFGATAAAHTQWPSVALPSEVHAYEAGKQITLNGMPMRIQIFESAWKLPALVDRLRESMGKPLVETQLGDQLVLGRAQGEFYVSVQLRNDVSGGRPLTRGVVAVTHLRAAYGNRDEIEADAARMLSRLPAGTRLVSRMSSDDGGKLATYTLFFNSHNEELNRERLAAAMRDDGLALEREIQLGKTALRNSAEAFANGRALYFKGRGKEATGVIARDESGRTSIALNIVTLPDSLK